jgi:hypothetical protein
VVAGQSVLAKEVLIMRYEEEGARTAVDLRIWCVTPETALGLSFADLAKASESP